MAPTKKSENVPKAMQGKFDSIVAITDKFSQVHLNDEYAQLIRYTVAALCRKRPSPLEKGRDKTWACGITHAIGMVNFLFDASQTPHISAKELYKVFGVGASTGQGKSKQVRDLLSMYQMDPNWSLPSRIDDNPMAWMISVNGFIIDARSAPREVQEMALAKGLIPYIPGDEVQASASPLNKSNDLSEEADSGNVSSKKSTAPSSPSSPNALYVLGVSIVTGPVTDDFIEDNPEISRTIAVKGSHTLKDLHQIIFNAFDREEEHLYEFQMGGAGPNDPKARRYGLKSPFDDETPAGYVSETTMASLGLVKDDVFGYWFDFGDDWWHQIDVVEVQEKAPKGKYPKVTKRVGASPPQYPDFD